MNWVRRAFNSVVEKLNPAQTRIAQETGTSAYSDAPQSVVTAFDEIETVNRGVSMIVNACASLDYDVKKSLSYSVVTGTRAAQLHTLLNFRPNPYQSALEFRKNIFTDFIIEGNAFVYYDGAFLYHLPAANVEILTDPKTFIKGYVYNGEILMNENEVFSFKDISSSSIYRGSSRLRSALKSIKAMSIMEGFQQSFFDNGAMFGLILTTENSLSNTAKEKTINTWVSKYNPKLGGKRPVILDNGLKPHAVTTATFQDMDFDVAIKTKSEKILTALGVPPILLAGGNNANISPNLRLFYLETVMPIVRSYTSALERYFGYDIEAISNSVSALQPDIKDVASATTTLVNGGIITPNEGRIELRYEAKETYQSADPDELRIPANIAGSAVDPSQGGRPPDSKVTEDPVNNNKE